MQYLEESNDWDDEDDFERENADESAFPNRSDKNASRAPTFVKFPRSYEVGGQSPGLRINFDLSKNGGPSSPIPMSAEKRHENRTSNLPIDEDNVVLRVQPRKTLRFDSGQESQPQPRVRASSQRERQIQDTEDGEEITTYNEDRIRSKKISANNLRNNRVVLHPRNNLVVQESMEQLPYSQDDDDGFNSSQSRDRNRAPQQRGRIAPTRIQEPAPIPQMNLGITDFFADDDLDEDDNEATNAAARPKKFDIEQLQRRITEEDKSLQEQEEKMTRYKGFYDALRLEQQRTNAFDDDDIRIIAGKIKQQEKNRAETLERRRQFCAKFKEHLQSISQMEKSVSHRLKTLDHLDRKFQLFNDDVDLRTYFAKKQALLTDKYESAVSKAQSIAESKLGIKMQPMDDQY